MAKRPIPEINAGSMADIAFLLLIFFLVTTTMDKDQAFIRYIPKKVEFKKDPEPVEEKNIFAIKANSNNQLLVRNEIMREPDKISDKILEFYRTNEKVNDPANNFPMYSRVDMDMIDAKIDEIYNEVDALESQPDVLPEIVDFKLNQAKEWEKKRDALKLLGKDELPEIHTQAHIRVEVQIKTAYELFAKIQTEIEEALFELRNDAAKELWGISYDVIKKRADSDPENKVDAGRLDLLKLLYPDRIIEVAPKQ